VQGLTTAGVIPCDPPYNARVFAARVSYRRGRTKTLPRYAITLLIAQAPFLPVLWGAFPQMPL
jgi:hypothetical protein